MNIHLGKSTSPGEIDERNPGELNSNRALARDLIRRAARTLAHDEEPPVLVIRQLDMLRSRL